MRQQKITPPNNRERLIQALAGLTSRITHYGALMLLVTLSYALAISGLSLIAIRWLNISAQLLVSGFVVFLLAIFLNPIRLKLQTLIERALSQDRDNHDLGLQALSWKFNQAGDISALTEELGQQIEDIFHPSLFHIFIYNPQSERYEPRFQTQSRPTSDLYFSKDSAIIQVLSLKKNSISLGNSDSIPELPKPEAARLALLGANLFTPLSGKNQLIGWVAIGPSLAGKPYTSKDLMYLEALCDQAGIAIERTQDIAYLEQRVREMDALSRIAQGVNITLTFDDILELIYAQTSQVIDNDDFRVILGSEKQGLFSNVFFIQDNERYPERENVPTTARSSLEGQILHTQHGLITQDYENECRQQGVNPDAAGIYAWIGVPLNAGAETIGAISIANRDPSVVYTGQHINLLQAIADQAAGAIIKNRLLAETQTKALQLASLNEIGRSLTSTLETKPLLNQIMQSATEILNCEAGSLFMVDDPTGELIFEVTIGPVADHLIDRHLPAGTGIVGKSAQSGRSLIVNEVHKSEYWYSHPDQDTGFVTRDILVVPMKIKERVLGVIEAINKRDGSQFTHNDEELLATFASQAAIAVENARLYTQTDAALRSRVEELSLMQRFDRELSSNLDLNRSLEITLTWSMRQARAEAGIICTPESDIQLPDGTYRIIIDQGYTKSTKNKTGEGIPVLHTITLLDETTLESLKQGLPVILESTDSHEGRPWVIQKHAHLDNDPSKAEPSLTDVPQEYHLPGSQTKILVPVLRQSEVLALMLLESTTQHSFSEESISMLSRISDHAAIAISNAQLYADLQAANIAKSDFISLVSHELKTPMTSIKGYTDLLAQGSVGPVNPAQADFLNIIRSNTNRMATLVSDLTDISRIEAGRLRLEFSAVPLGQVIEDVYRSVKAQIDHKQMHLDIDLPGDLPFLWGDFHRLSQIVSNLLSNAIKYTPEGGRIAISARPAAIEAEGAGRSKVIRIDIRDTGIGIPAGDQDKVFQKFFRSDAPEVSSTPGTGLGLNITRHLVNMQGGQIWFESQPGQGTQFSFTIPIASGILKT